MAGNDRLSPVNWYFCPVGAQIFTAHNSFASLNWSHGSPAGNSVGEVIGSPRPYSKGVNPGTVGTNFCGAVGDYLGIGEFLSAPRPTYPSGVPSCCNPVVIVNCQWWKPNHDNSYDTAEVLTPGYTIRKIADPENENYYRLSGPIGFDFIEYATAGTCLDREYATAAVADSNGDQFYCTFISGTEDGTEAIWQTPNIPGEIPVVQIKVMHNQ